MADVGEKRRAESGSIDPAMSLRTTGFVHSRHARTIPAVQRHSLGRVIVMMAVIVACTGPAGPDASGSDLYSQFCARCHSADLSGGIGPAIGEGSQLVDRPDSYIAQVLENGRGSMPAFGNTLSEDQVARVIQFIRAKQSP